MCALACLGAAFWAPIVCYSQVPDTFSLGPKRQVMSVTFEAWKREGVKGVIVITPSFGINPTDTNLIEQNEWKEFASKHSLGLMFADISISTIPSQIKDDKLSCIDGISETVRDGVIREFGVNMPTFVYGRNDNSTLQVLSMIVSSPGSFIGWCCNGPDFFKAWPHFQQEVPPGIVSCTTDSIRYDDAKKFFSNARKSNYKLTWLASRPIDSTKVRDFIRTYCLALMTSSAGEWRDVDTRKIIEPEVASDGTENSTWLPDLTTGEMWAALEADRPLQPTIVEKEIDLSGHQLPNLHLYLLIPNGQKDAGAVDGVMAYCTWTKERDTLLQQLSNDTEQPVEKIELPSVQMLRFAAKHNLAVLTWSTPGEWNVDENGNEVSEKEKLDVDRQFDLFASAWEEGVSELCRDYKLPENDYLLFGMSRGAQWAHRLLLRDPKRFLAISIHVSGSYDEPTDAGKNCLWLVTSGELDGGLNHSKQFYASCLKLGYPIVFKAPNHLGHEMRSDVDIIRNAFFDYALSIKKQEQYSNVDLGSLISLKNAKYIGDDISQKVVTVDNAVQIKQENQVYLPTDALAAAWEAQPPEQQLASPTSLQQTAVISTVPVNTINSAKPVIIANGNINSLLQNKSNNVVVGVPIATPPFLPKKLPTATVIIPTNIEAITPSGGRASIPLALGAKLIIISINEDGSVTAINSFNFQGEVPQSCVSIDKP